MIYRQRMGTLLCGWAHLLYPGPQVRRTLVKAGVLDEVLLALGCHVAAVVNVEVVELGKLLMGLLGGVGPAAGVFFPWRTLESEQEEEKEEENYEEVEEEDKTEEKKIRGTNRREKRREKGK